MHLAGTAESPFGTILVAGSEDALHWLSFVNQPEAAAATLHHQFPGTTYSPAASWSQSIVDQWIKHQDALIPLRPFGTSFQKIVWNKLMNVPLGTTISYGELARLAGHPTAVRAVASAVARNPIALLIPCHRVLPKDGSLGNYRWGSDRTRALLEWESAASQ